MHSHFRILLNSIQLGENPAVLFCFDFLPRPSKSIKKYHFCKKFGNKKPINHRIPDVGSQKSKQEYFAQVWYLSNVALF